MSPAIKTFLSAAAAATALSVFTPAQAANWTATATKALPLVNATDLGALDAATPLRIAVALQMQNADALKALVQAQNDPASILYGTTITPDDFNATYAPSADQVAAVVNYLSTAGLSDIAVEPNALFVTASGTAGQIGAAFNTSLENFAQNGQTIFVNTAPAQVPAELGGIVLSVLGLNNIQATTHPKKVTPCDLTTPTCVRLTYNPQTYWAAYDVGTTPTGRNTTIAVMAEGDVSGVIPDLRIFEKMMGLPQVPVSIVQVGIPSPDTAGADEWNLDTQYTTGMAGNVKELIIYATTSLTDGDIGLEINKWVTQNKAKVANASFGGCEFNSYLDGSMVATDQALLQGAAQGQTLFASTGDTGSFCSVGNPNGAPGGAPFVEYPAASPYVVAVGGTTLLTNADGSYQGEIAWYATGGGISQFEYSPYWQAGVAPTSAVSGIPFSFRAMPDVAMDADPNTGAIVIVNGQQLIVGGTSLSSPLSVGTYARFLTAHPKLGFASPRLYRGYSSLTAASPSAPGGTNPLVDGFNDVLIGANGFYTALPYFDYVSGLGTFDVAKKNKILGQ